MPFRSVAVGQRDGLGQAERRGVARVLAGHRLQEQRGVGRVARERARLVERGGEGDHAVAADRAVGRLEPDDPAQRRRLADRAAGVGADRPRNRAGGDRRGRATRRPARNARAVPRVERRAVGRVLGRRAHRELVLVGLGQHRGSRVHEALDRGRGVGRSVALEDLRARLRGDALGAEQVLDPDRDAAERATRVDGLRIVLAADPGEGVEVVGQRAVAVEAPQLAAREIARANALGGLRRRQLEDLAHPAPGLGTRKPPRAGSGALSSAFSRGSEGRGSSARRTFSTATT